MFTEAIKKEPNNVDARRYLAHALVESGSSEAAIAQYGALVTLNAMNNRDALSYAKALSNTGNTERAVDILSHYLQTSPAEAALRAELIRMYMSIGFAQKAEAAYREGLPYAQTGAQRALLDGAYGGARRGGGRGSTSPGGSKVTNSELGG
jgi:predicted Zn-dependent protease